MKDLREMTAAELTAVTWSDEPAPGGGSISAFAGSLAAALTGMVANLSQSTKYEAVMDEMASIAKEMNVLREQLLLAMQQDTEAFSLYMTALSMPKNTDEEKAARRAAMQNGLKQAVETPLKVAESIVPVFPLIERLIQVGNPNAVTDALVASMMARSGILGAIFNVKVNLESIRDEGYVQQMRSRLYKLERSALDGEKAVFALSVFSADMGI